ncbi:hypothetical protein KAF25_009563 [Fusarium avenaceum]|uniref:Nudix hydrolase domain-containing protein n=1 Tax=Fusarium avenaceum TaxID=40199 RepID=A0A9P7HBY1_9HYPO|nr:hypothetical protein KAF25_009563 [Fusarium avenaceum]
MSQKTQEPVITRTSDLPIEESKWVTLKKIEYVDQVGKARTWEVATRKTRGKSGVDAVAMGNILLHPSKPASTLLVIQYRPPLDAYTIEWPAGLIDAEETAEQAAVREFKEETGYDCKVLSVSPAQAADPGMTNANMQLAMVEVQLGENEEEPEQRLDDGEHIQREIIPLAELYDRLVEYSKKERTVVAAKLFHFAAGMHFAQTQNKPTDTGMSRLALSDADKTVRDWFVETTKSLGCKVTIDAIGNVFAVRPGRNDGPPTLAGSHLDTQPSGGRYDGILGIQAGIEMLKILQEHDVETEYPVGVVNWTNEEGARFPISMMASGVWAESIALERAHNLKEVAGNATVKAELGRIGYHGETPASFKSMPIGAHFELHIEQGPILERAQKKIGVVQDAHTGSTPFADRADALLLAARLITHSHRLATKHNALASTGILNLTPGSTNTIPGHVSFSLDIRSPSDETVEKLEKELRRDFDLLARGTDVDGLLAGSTPALTLSLEWRTDTISNATKFHPDCIQAVRDSAESILGKDAAIDISSGAGHDSVYTNKHCPTTMIFIPCKGGVSHNPEEYSTPEECAIGAEVLCQAVVRYDQKRVE